MELIKLGSQRWRRAAVPAFIAVILLCYVFLLFRVEAMNFDSYDYYKAAMSLRDGNGNFSIANFASGIRGVSFALWLFALDTLAKLLSVKIYYAVLTVNFLLFFLCAYAFLGLFVSWEELRERRVETLGGVTAGLVLFTVLARFAFTTVLTDFPAFALCLLGAVCVKWASTLRLSVKTAALALFGGGCLYTAYNFRTIYLLGVLVLAVYLAAALFRHGSKLRALLVPAAVLAGMLLAAYPQVIVNRVNYGSSSPMVSTSYTPNGASLFVKQLIWGMELWRYDANLDLAAYSNYPLYFFWVPGEALTSLVQRETLTEYCGIMLTHPFHFIALYLTHLLNMLSPYFAQVYITNLSVAKWPYLFLMYGVCYCVVWDIASKFRTKLYTLRGLLDSKFIPVLAVLIPGLAIVPGAVEYRFGMPLFWLIFTYFVWGCSWKQRWIDLKAAPVGRCLGFLAGLAAMICFWVQVMASGPVPLGL